MKRPRLFSRAGEKRERPRASTPNQIEARPYSADSAAAADTERPASECFKVTMSQSVIPNVTKKYLDYETVVQ